MKRITLLHVFLSAATLATSFIPMSAPAAPGDLYMADAVEGRIFKFTPAGTRSTFASGLHQPVALAFDREGNLFVGDSGAGIPPQSSRIFKVTADGTESTFATVPSDQLLGMAFDGAGNLFVSTGLDILKFAPDGTQSTFASDVDGVWPLAFDKLGNLYAGVNPIGPSSVLKFAPDGSSSTFISFPAGSSVTALAFDSGSDLFVNVGESILKVTFAGSTTTFASGDFQPNSLAFDTGGNLFAGLDAFSSNEAAIVKFTPDGTRTTFAFGPLLTSALAFEPVTEKLRNISARGFVQTGDNVLIGGFILGGNGLATNTVVVRAIGPSLSQFGIANPLPDPTLELHNGSGAIIASNDNWQDTQAAQITASGLAPTNPHESAIFATLPAGNFTAIVRGVSDTTGVALVEVYNLH
jgi:hypothetical protein